MKRERKSFSKNPPSASLEFSISRFHLVWHIFGLILTAGLSISLVMAELSYRMHPHAHHNTHIGQTIVLYVLLLLFVSTIFITTILTACKIKISQQGVEISNLFWRQKLTRADIQTFKAPADLPYAWLKTKHLLYLLAKNEFKDWPDLEEALKDHISRH